MFNIGDTLYAARNILYHDVFEDENEDVYYERGTKCTVIEIEDCGAASADLEIYDDWGFHFHVAFDVDVNPFFPSENTWRFSNVSLFTKVKPE